jgi:hypothetical protein
MNKFQVVKYDGFRRIQVIENNLDKVEASLLARKMNLGNCDSEVHWVEIMDDEVSGSC